MRKIGDKVWIVSMGGPCLGTITKAENGEFDVKVKAGILLTYRGLPGHRLHNEKKGAVMEIYSFWAEQHHKMGRILQKASAFFDDPDALIKHLEQIEICSIVENT